MKIVSLKDIAASTTSHNKVGRKKQMIAPGEIPHLLQFAQATINPGDIVEEHKHDGLYEIFFVESGSGDFRVNRKEYIVEKGMSITFKPHELHEVENTGDEKLVLTYFSIII